VYILYYTLYNASIPFGTFLSFQFCRVENDSTYEIILTDELHSELKLQKKRTQVYKSLHNCCAPLHIAFLENPMIQSECGFLVTR